MRKRTRMRRAALASGVVGATVAALVAQADAAVAAPSSTWSFAVGQTPTGLTTGGQLAFDERTGMFYITNNTFPIDTDNGISFPDARPRVGVFNTRTQRPVRAIDMSGQPTGVHTIGPLPVPMGQIPTASPWTRRTVAW